MPSFKKKKVVNALEKKLNMDFRRGKELNAWYILDGIKVLRVTVPHGRKELTTGVFHSIRNQLKLSNDQISNLVRCPLKGKDYEQIIRAKHVAGLL